MKIKKNGIRAVLAAGLAAGIGLSLFAAPIAAEARETKATGPALEAEMKKAAETAAETPWDGDVNTLKCAADATQLIIVVSDPTNPAKASFSWYRRGADNRLAEVMTENEFCVNGMNGVSADKKEGDKKTPAGVFHFSGAFGLLENPGTTLPYHKIVSGDYYVDDPASTHYNTLVNTHTTAKDWSSAENLMASSPYYDYALIIDYNKENVPGKGSAIFLHCPKKANNTGTLGCVTIPEEKMKQVVREVDAGTKILIVPSREDIGKY